MDIRLDGYHVEQWFATDIRLAILRTRDQILTDDDLNAAFRSALGLVFMFVVCRKPESANQLLETLFKIEEFGFWGQYEAEKHSLELFWISFGGRPLNTPWNEWSPSLISELRNRPPRHPYHHYSVQLWSNDLRSAPIPEDYDIHQWKDSQDWRIHSLCAKLLCKPAGGTYVPTRDNLEEAFEALDKMFAVTPPGSEFGVLTQDIYTVRVYFVLALYFDHREKARDLMRIVMKTDGQPHVGHLLDSPALYEFLAENDDLLIKSNDDAEMERAKHVISVALNSRAEQGIKLPLHDVPISELLRRFSEAVFFTNNKDYLENGINKPEKILRPPLTEEEVAEVEEKLGEPLPPDLKELVLVADGFKGGWHFAGGGWGGIKNSWKERASDHEIYLGYMPEPQLRTEMATRDDGSAYPVTTFTHNITVQGSTNDWGDVWGSDGVMENDGFLHLICPPTTWKKIQAAMGNEIEDGVYAYLNYAAWSGGGKIYPSVRAMIAELTMKSERLAAVGLTESEGY
ncbi:hypothetical protein V490_00593 [Pseudogymnoascus sp. VKM F-3557]|nr:hypothetical protein V490_00593 [Pseudogymnoascus sp. VKM F-3557]